MEQKELDKLDQKVSKVVSALRVAMRFIEARRMKSCKCSVEAEDVLKTIDNVLKDHSQ